MELKSGKLLKNGEYRIERVLGKGGFGITYLAYQIGLDRKVAIKEFFMSDFCNRDADTSHVSVPSVGSKETVEKFKIKFIKEAKNIASLNNPHIIRIHDIFEDNGTAYYVMEYHDGGSLQGLIDRRGRLSEQEALVYIRQIADALQYIHKRNMNHLDVKPGNVLLDDEGNAVLIDFGLSKRYDAEGNQTSTTPVGISHGYAPFEQYQHGGVSTFSPATDIYSLGATFYKLITGNTPPNATVVGEDGLPPYPSPVSLSTSSAIEKSMQLLRKNRPQSIAEFLALLVSSSSASAETLIAEEAGESTVFPENEKSEKQEVEVKVSQSEDGKKKLSSWIFVLLAVLLIAGIGVGLYVFFSGNGNTENESVSDTDSVAVVKIDSLANKDSADTVSANTNVVVNTIIYEDTDENVSADTHVESNTNANENVKQEDSNKKSDKAENSKDNLTAEELYKEGVKYYNAKDYAKAVEFYRKAAELGHAYAQNNLGVCYEVGQGVSQDYSEAVKWYRKAAEQGDAVTQYHLGVCYYLGQGVSQDYSEAVKWYRKAAEQGDADAQYWLGVCYYNGEGVDWDASEAMKWWGKAAEQGHEQAKNNWNILADDEHQY